jgi:hypothetical protein
MIPLPRTPLTAFVYVCLVATASAGEARVQDCLFAQDDAARPAKNCRPDPLELGKLPAMKALIAAYGLSSARIDFVGCDAGRYQTKPNLNAEAGSYKITYVINARYAAGDYVLPLSHEIAHVFQAEHVGGWAKLTSEPLVEIELGADFLAGHLYKTALKAPNPSAFHTSLELLGDYAADDLDSHGKPEDRTTAFRFGFFFRAESGSQLQDAYDTFRRDYYPKIRGM